MSAARERLVNEPILDVQCSFSVTTTRVPPTAWTITGGTPEENARLVEALRTVLGTGAARS